MSSFTQIGQDILEKIKIFYSGLTQKLKHLTESLKTGKTVSKTDQEDQLQRSGSRKTVPHPAKSKPIRRRGRQKVYRLKGYTTVAKVNRKRQSERQQRLLRRALLFVVFILAIVLLYNLYNPFKNIAEWYRFIGISSLNELITGKTNSTLSTTAGTETTISVTLPDETTTVEGTTAG